MTKSDALTENSERLAGFREYLSEQDRPLHTVHDAVVAGLNRSNRDESEVAVDGELAQAILRDPSLRSIANDHGRTVAHQIVGLRPELACWTLEQPDLRQLAGRQGYTVAHHAVASHRLAAEAALELPEVRKLTNDKGVTVAHLAAFTWGAAAERALADPDVCTLKGGVGTTVAHVAIGQASVNKNAVAHAISCPIIGRLSDHAGHTVLETAASQMPHSLYDLLVAKLRDGERQEHVPSEEYFADVLLALARRAPRRLTQWLLNGTLGAEASPDRLAPLLRCENPEIRSAALRVIGRKSDEPGT